MVFAIIPERSSGNETAPGQPELRFAITAAVASDPGFAHYKDLTEYISGKLGRKCVFISGLTYSQVDNLFRAGDLDVGFLCNAHYARTKKEVKFEAIAAPVLKCCSKPQFQVYVIVNRDSRLESIADIKGMSVDCSDPLSTTALYAKYLLLEKKTTPESYFSKVIYSGGHEMTLQLVANKMVEAGFIDGHIWEYENAKGSPYTAKTRIIHKSRYFTIPPVVVSASMPRQSKTEIKNILLNMHKDPAGERILKALYIEKFVQVSDRDYDNVHRLYLKVNGRF